MRLVKSQPERERGKLKRKWRRFIPLAVGVRRLGQQLAGSSSSNSSNGGNRATAHCFGQLLLWDWVTGAQAHRPAQTGAAEDHTHTWTRRSTGLANELVKRALERKNVASQALFWLGLDLIKLREVLAQYFACV